MNFRDIRVQHLAKQGLLAWRLLSDRRVPLVFKLIPAAAVFYLISPVDFIPDVFPVLGQIDDLAVMLLAVKLFVGLAPPAIVSEYSADEAVTTTYRVHDE